jgi:hypothetical protein
MKDIDAVRALKTIFPAKILGMSNIHSIHRIYATENH